MRSNSRLFSIAGLALGVAMIAGACSSAAATPASNVAGATQAPATAPATAAAAATTLTLASTNDPALGAYLTGQNGMTLYILTKDPADGSGCTGSCATNWPPLTVAAGTTIAGPTGATGAFATFTRADGTMQVTYNHLALYYFAGDSKAGDTTGQGKNGVWFVAPLSGTVTPAVSATSPSGY